MGVERTLIEPLGISNLGMAMESSCDRVEPMLGWNDDVDEAPDVDEKNLIRDVLSRTALCLDHKEAERTTIYTLLALVAVFMFEIGGGVNVYGEKDKEQEFFLFFMFFIFIFFIFQEPRYHGICKAVVGQNPGRHNED